MFKIYKSVSLKETPVVIEPPEYLQFEPPEHQDEGENEGETESDDTEVRREIHEKLSDAEERVKAMLEEAAEEAERIKQAAYDEGYQQGFRDGQIQGEQTALSEAKQSIDEAAQRAQYILALTDKQASQMLDTSERQIIEISLTIAAKVIAREIEENPSVVLPMVKAALDRIRDQERITIRVNPDDYDLVVNAKHDLLVTLNRDCNLSVLPDESLNRGDCVAETPFGTVDARVDTQLSLLKTALQDILP